MVALRRREGEVRGEPKKVVLREGEKKKMMRKCIWGSHHHQKGASRCISVPAQEKKFLKSLRSFFPLKSISPLSPSLRSLTPLTQEIEVGVEVKEYKVPGLMRALSLRNPPLQYRAYNDWLRKLCDALSLSPPC